MTTTPYVDLATVHSPTSGTTPPVAWGTDIRNNLQILANPPGCIVSRSTAQAITTGTGTVIAFTAADLRDTDAYHDTSTNPSRMTVPTGLGGLYAIQASLVFAANATGQRTISLQKNGTTALTVANDFPFANAGIATGMTQTVWALLSAGDYVEVNVFQNSGGNLNVTAAQASLIWQGVT